MGRYLVVANQTLGGEQLMTRLREFVADEVAEVHVLVPASADPTTSFHDEDSDRELAQRRLEEALSRFAELDATLTGEVGDHRPTDAVGDLLRRGERFDRVIVSTLPAGISRWLRLDVVSRLERVLDVPVEHVIHDPQAAAGRH